MRQLKLEGANIEIGKDERLSVDDITYSHPKQPADDEPRLHAFNCTTLSMEFNEFIPNSPEYCIVEPGFNNIHRLTDSREYIKFTMTDTLATRLLVHQKIKDEKLINADMFCTKLTAQILGIKGKLVQIVKNDIPQKFIRYREYCYNKNKTKVLDSYSANTIIDMLHNGVSHAFMAIDLLKNFNLKESSMQLQMIIDRCKDIKTPSIDALVGNLRELNMMISCQPPKVTKTKQGYYVTYNGNKILEVSKNKSAYMRVDNHIYLHYAAYYLGIPVEEVAHEIEYGAIQGDFK